MTRTQWLSILCVCAMLSGVSFLRADLGPSAHESSTSLRWIEALPFEISEPGTYRLRPGLAISDSAPAILITASGVSLQLEGNIIGGAGLQGTGLLAMGKLEDVSVTGGTVRDFAGDGIDLSAVRGARLDHVTTFNNGGHGFVLGDDAVATDCIAHLNFGGRGYEVGARAYLRRCKAEMNEYGGLWAGAGAVLIDCVSVRNIYGAGIKVGEASIVRGGEVRGGEDLGLRLGPRSLAEAVHATGNLVVGFELEARARARNCRALGTRDGPGFSLAEGAEITDCVASGNAGWGVRAAAEVRVSDCQIEQNRAGGLSLEGPGSAVIGNTSLSNEGLDLVMEGSEGLVLANRARGTALRLGEGNETGPVSGPWSNHFD